jgi:hypothetical protein
MKILRLGLASTLLLVASASPARADLQPDPCMGKANGDACTSYNNKPGTCVPDPQTPGALLCQESGMSGSGGGSSATTTGTTTSASSGTNSSSAGGGADGSDGERESSGDCSFRQGAPSGIGTWAGAAAAMIAAGLLLARRRR